MAGGRRSTPRRGASAQPTTAISVVLPTYNEAGNIGRLIGQILDVLGSDCELLVVDDGSSDGTDQLVAELAQRDSRIELIARRNERGLGTAVAAGIQASRGRLIAVMDTDFNHDPAVLPLMRDLCTHVDIVVGSRFVTGGGMEDQMRYYLSWLYNVGLRVVLGTRIQDNLSGYFVARRELLTPLDVPSIFYGYGDYFFRLLQVVIDQGARVIEVPVYYPLRREGVSKTNLFTTFFKYSKAVLELVREQGIEHRPARPHGADSARSRRNRGSA